ncbi:MAG: PCRF domain-containing protein [Thermoleophilaceae bacterium]|nr:PCRF domain-containing protein [Thermoleophilaceae bacterium]
MGEPGFWDDPERAQKVSAEHAAAARKLTSYRELESELGDLEELEQMADEDPSVAVEVEEQRTGFEAKLAELEEARLFAGRYDDGDAVVTVNAGAGGTDSQDWAEMLLRMEMRFAEGRGRISHR